jgi:hypothetical protein
MFDWLRWIVGSAVIKAEWTVYSTPWLRTSDCGAALWYLAVLVVCAPLLAVWLPLEAVTLLWYWAMVPRGPPLGGAPRYDPVLRVASFNIQSGVGGDMRRDIPRTARALRKLDVELVALQEIELSSAGEDRDESDFYFRKTATEYDRKPGK